MLRLVTFLLFFQLTFLLSKSQCLTAPVYPLCTGVEPQTVSGDIINTSVTKWFYNSPTTIGTLKMNGGTLIVCSDLTVDKFYMDSGTIVIQPGARFVIGSGIGSGMQLFGNSRIYNYGVFECRRNLSLENAYASLSKPNIFINATTNSVFKMPGLYFVINNPYSWF